MRSWSRIGAMNSIASIATVATRPSASRAATMPAAMSIWERTQPPKIWPLALMSPGRGTTRNIASPLWLIVMVALRPGSLVVPAIAAEIDEAHEAGAEQHGEADAGNGRDHHMERDRN